MPRYEVSFFEDPDYDEKNIFQIEVLLESGRGKRAIGIKRPDYLARSECPPRLAKHLPQAKLIAVLRNPADRLLSAYYWYMQVGIIPIRPAEEGITDLITGQCSQTFPKSQEIIDYGFYYRHLNRYLQYYDREQILVLFHRDVVMRPLEMIQQVYDFLQIDNDFIPQALKWKPKQTIYALPRVRFLAMANRLFFFNYYTYDDNRQALRPKNGELIKNLYRTCLVIDRFLLALIYGNQKPGISQQLSGQIETIYENDIASLEKLLGVDLMHWRKRR